MIPPTWIQYFDYVVRIECTPMECLDTCPVAELDRQAGGSVSRVGKQRFGRNGAGWGMTSTGSEYNDSGGASRFFHVTPPVQPFIHSAKAGADERPFYWAWTCWCGHDAPPKAAVPCPTCGDKSVRRSHETVKPLYLIRQLVKLVTRPGGTVLDPFAGSGTTGEAALMEGMDAILIEREADYIPLIQQRIDRVESRPTLF